MKNILLLLGNVHLFNKKLDTLNSLSVPPEYVLPANKNINYFLLFDDIVME